MPSERVQRQIDRLLDECEEAARQMNWTLVQERAQAALDFDPDSADAQEFLAAAQRAQVRLDVGPPAHVLGSSRPPDMGDGRGEMAQQPTAFANGRYEVKRFLGEGGKKRVYLAHDTLLDRDVFRQDWMFASKEAGR